MRLTLPPYESAISRTMDARFLNTVANHPDVRPWLGGEGPIDLTALLLNPANLAGVVDDGGFLAVNLGAGRYEVHSLFLPTKKRGAAVRAMRAAVAYIFSVSDCNELVTKVPDGNLAAKGLAQLAGFEPSFHLTIPWTGGARVGTSCMALSLDRWALSATSTRQAGEWLHEAFERVKAEYGSTEAHSPDDVAHHHAAGAALLMVQAGNAGKACAFYDRWAAFAGYPPIRLLREHPTVIDLEGIVVEVVGNEIEVLSCR